MGDATAAGQPVTLYLDFYNEESGALTDPAALQLDITYGDVVGFTPDVAGPFTYSGASAYAAGEIWRTGTGQYAFTWPAPSDADAGVYVANWTCLFDGDNFLATENFVISSGAPPRPPVASGDTGYWTGSIVYTPSPGNLAQLTGASIPLGEVDEYGIAWLLQKVEGWDGPDVQGGGVLPKSGDHGGWPTPQYYAPRAITLTIMASAPAQTQRDLARSLLQSAVPISDLALFTYGEPVPKQALVRRSGKIPETYPTLVDVSFSVLLIAPDPRKYGTQLHSLPVNAFPSSLVGVTLPFTLPVTLPDQQPGGTAVITNAGDFETRPVITVYGPITSPVLTNVTTGQQVSWTGLALQAGDVLVADFGIQQATLNGAFRSADLSSSWWVLPGGVPGGCSCTIALGGQSDAGASMQVSWSDAWR